MILKKLLQRVVIPMIIVFFFMFLFMDWILGNKALSENLLHTGEEWKLFFKKMLLEWQVPAPYVGPLWYLYVYIILSITQPIGAVFVRWLDTAKKKKMFLALSAGLLFLNDLSGNTFGEFTHHVFRAAVPATIIMMWGFILYPYRDRILRRLSFLPSLLLFLGINAARFLALIPQYTRSEPNNTLLYWYTVPGLICAVLIYSMCYHITKIVKAEGTVEKCIQYIGARTFVIFLIHQPIVIFLKDSRIGSAISKWAGSMKQIFVQQLLYILVLGGLVFLIAVVISALINLVSKMIKGFANEFAQ